jgi:hypothetical protein
VTCELCGIESRDVRSGLALYAADDQFERMDRCVDHQTCRDRLEETGEEWPLSDLTYSKKGVAP